MNAKIAVLFAFVCAASGRVFLLDDFEGETLSRVRRDVPGGPGGPVEYLEPERQLIRRDSPGYAPPPQYAPEPVYHAPKAHGRVGPVYTFVKTDPQANFKWGVRHRAGAQYGR